MLADPQPEQSDVAYRFSSKNFVTGALICLRSFANQHRVNPESSEAAIEYFCRKKEMEGRTMVRSLIMVALVVIFGSTAPEALEANDYLVGGQFNTPRVTHYRYKQTGQITYYGPRCCPPANGCHTANYAPTAATAPTPVTSSVYQPVVGGPAYNVRSNYTPYQLGQTSVRPRRSWMINPFAAPQPAVR